MSSLYSVLNSSIPGAFWSIILYLYTIIKFPFYSFRNVIASILTYKSWFVGTTRGGGNCSLSFPSNYRDTMKEPRFLHQSITETLVVSLELHYDKLEWTKAWREGAVRSLKITKISAGGASEIQKHNWCIGGVKERKGRRAACRMGCNALDSDD